jgi:hypothetical protein
MDRGVAAIAVEAFVEAGRESLHVTNGGGQCDESEDHDGFEVSLHGFPVPGTRFSGLARSR